MSIRATSSSSPTTFCLSTGLLICRGETGTADLGCLIHTGRLTVQGKLRDFKTTLPGEQLLATKTVGYLPPRPPRENSPSPSKWHSSFYCCPFSSSWSSCLSKTPSLALWPISWCSEYTCSTILTVPMWGCAWVLFWSRSSLTSFGFSSWQGYQSSYLALYQQSAQLQVEPAVGFPGVRLRDDNNSDGGKGKTPITKAIIFIILIRFRSNTEATRKSVRLFNLRFDLDARPINSPVYNIMNNQQPANYNAQGYWCLRYY